MIGWSIVLLCWSFKWVLCSAFLYFHSCVALQHGVVRGSVKNKGFLKRPTQMASFGERFLLRSQLLKREKDQLTLDCAAESFIMLPLAPHLSNLIPLFFLIGSVCCCRLHHASLLIKRHLRVVFAYEITKRCLWPERCSLWSDMSLSRGCLV